MRCHDVEILLSVRRDLNLSQRAEVESHLAGCRACAAARRAEDRTSRLLAQLPSPAGAAPPRVAAAIQRLSARRVAAGRLRDGLILSAGLGAAALFVAVLINIISGGALLDPARTVETAAQPTAPGAAAAGAARPADTLYLIHQPAPGDHRLIAWEPASDQARFSVELGAIIYGSPYQRVGELAPGPNVALAPDGAAVYVIQESAAAADLAAYSAADGSLRWRRQLGALQPLQVESGQGRLSVSPDGSRVFLRVAAIDPSSRSADFFAQRVRAFDSATGAEITLDNPTIEDAALILPISNDQLVIATHMGELVLASLAEGGPPESRISETAVAAALLPDGKTIYALRLDLTLLIIDVQPGGLQLRGAIDLVEPGYFFFEHAAISPDGQTIAVGLTRRDTGGASSEVRVYRTTELQRFQPDQWPAITSRLLDRRRRFERPLTGLAASPDGMRVYVTLGPAAAAPGSEPQPSPGPQGPARGALVTIAIGEPLGGETAAALDPQIIGVAAAR